MIKSSPSLDQLSRQKSKSDQNLSCTDDVLDQLALKRSLSGTRLSHLNILVPEVGISVARQAITGASLVYTTIY